MRNDAKPLHWMRRNAPLALALSLLELGGCLFTPREAPPPCDPQDLDCKFCPFNEPLSPTVVRDNIIVALECLLVEPNYEESLSAKARGEESFEYVPDPTLVEAFPGVFDGWDEDREVQFMRDLLETGSERPTRVDFNVTRFVDTGEFTSGNKARYDVEYDLTLTYVDSTQDPPVESTRRYCATALWDLIGGNNNSWKLQKWEEISPSNQGDCLGSMGLLRATTGQGP